LCWLHYPLTKNRLNQLQAAHITLRRQSWTPPASFAFGGAELKPLASGEALQWRLQT
jgi:dihydroorotase